MDQLNFEKTNPRKGFVTMLPVIDLKPNDESCLHSTFLRVID